MAPTFAESVKIPVIHDVEDGDADRWNGFVAGSDGASLYHRYEWRGLIRRVFGKHSVYLAAADETGEWQGVLPLVHMKSLLFGNFMVSMPYVNYGGVLARDRAIAAALAEAAADHAERLGCAHVEFRQDVEGLLELPARTSKVTMILPLPDSAEELWSSFKPKLRAQIRRPEKDGAEWSIGGVELLDEFYAVFAVNMRDLGTPVYARRFFAAVLETFASARIAVVRMGGTAVAAGLVLGDGSRLEIPWASSLRSHNRSSPNMLLYFELLKWAIEQGYTAFDFGRCTRDAGTYRFKKQWGALEHPLHWHYWLQGGGALPELNPDNPAFAMLVRAWQKLPVALTRAVGPQIVKHLP